MSTDYFEIIIRSGISLVLAITILISVFGFLIKKDNNNFLVKIIFISFAVLISSLANNAKSYLITLGVVILLYGNKQLKSLFGLLSKKKFTWE